MQSSQTITNNELNRLFRLQATRTYEYYILHLRAMDFSPFSYEENYWNWMNCPSACVNEVWYQRIQERIEAILGARKKYDRMVQAKVIFENAGGKYFQKSRVMSTFQNT